jgi:hypothetical protein
MDAAAGKPARAGRWILLGIAAFIVLLIIVCAAFLFLPVRRVSPAELLPSGSFAFCSYRIDRADPAVAAMIGAMKERLVGKGSGFKRAIVGLFLPVALPHSVVVAISSRAAAPEPEILIFADVGSLSRLLGLFGGSVDGALFQGAPVAVTRVKGGRISSRSDVQGGFHLSAWSIVGGTLILGSSLDAVKECLSAPGGTGGDIPSRLGKALDTRDIVLYFDNASGGMSRLVTAASEKYAFAAFPSVDSVTTVSGAITLMPEKADGSVAFTAASKLEDVQSDVKFLYGALRRVAHASGVAMSGNISTQGNQILFTFEVTDYLTLLSGENK